MPNLIPDVVPAGSMRDRPQPSIPAGDLLLRPWQPADLPVVIAAYADPDIQRWHLESLDRDEAISRIERYAVRWQNETHADWAVTEAATGTVLGRVGLRRAQLDEGFAELAYWVLPNARRRGVALAGSRAVINWAFDDLGLHHLDLHHSVHNPASCRVATRSGFSLVGVRREYARHPDGWHDYHLHELISDRKTPLTG